MTTIDADLLIRGGTVVDGTGAHAQRADVAVKGERVLAVGPALKAHAPEVIDATGLLVTPGFVDIHTHYDGQATWEHTLGPSTEHGVTTVLTGNCGVGFAPCRPEDRDRLVKLMEGIEDLPEIVLSSGIPWNWQSFPEYLDALAARRYDCDIATQVPHAALRVFAMGRRAVDREEATPEDRALMARLAREAIEAGALGFATSRTINHRASDGIPVPTLTAAEEELTAIGETLGALGRGVLQLVSDFADCDTELPMLRRIAERAGRPMSVSLMQWHHVPEKWRTVLDWIERCNADGVCIRAQVSGRPIGLNLGWQLSFNPFSYTPSFREISALPWPERLARLRDPAVRARIVNDTPEPSGFPGEGLMRLWTGIYPLGEQPFYEPTADQSVAALAAARGVRPAELAYDLLMAQDGEAMLMAPTVNFAGNSLEAARQMLRHPDALYGLGDGGAHLGFLCDASLPTHMLQYWVRDRLRGERIPLEEVVHGWTQRTASAVGLLDRGVIAAGYKADINLIDAKAVALLPPRVRHDLPAGGRRMVQGARGYVATIVSGTVVRREGVHTGALPGRVVRGAQAGPR
jgi:N-acyl-D-aspartate/D-glutamate deacylase